MRPRPIVCEGGDSVTVVCFMLPPAPGPGRAVQATTPKVKRKRYKAPTFRRSSLTFTNNSTSLTTQNSIFRTHQHNPRLSIPEPHTQHVTSRRCRSVTYFTCVNKLLLVVGVDRCRIRTIVAFYLWLSDIRSRFGCMP